MPWEGENVEPDEDGDFPRWDGPHLKRLQDQYPAQTWALVFMQQEVSEDSVFHPKCVMASVQGNRRAGPWWPAHGATPATAPRACGSSPPWTRQ
jgi:hypothetical protein